MSLSKKDKLIESLKALKMKDLDHTIRDLETKEFFPNYLKKHQLPEMDTNTLFTVFIYEQILKPHPEIMHHPNGQMLKDFLEKEIGPIKESPALKRAFSIKR